MSDSPLRTLGQIVYDMDMGIWPYDSLTAIVRDYVAGNISATMALWRIRQIPYKED